jgi:nucleoside-diphosphate-sugar epimerase
MNRLLIFGQGYSGSAIAKAASAAGFAVAGTTRAGSAGTIRFDEAASSIAAATHIVASAAPDSGADPVLARYRDAIAAAPALRWIGYLSTTGVYGNRDGGWVDEDTPPVPTQSRGAVRVAVESDWSRFAGHHAVGIFRLGGIYGPGRSALADIRAGRARRVIKPGHSFSRIHRDDIAQAVVAAMLQDPPPGRRVFNLADDEPVESARVVEEAAALLGMPLPPAVAFADAVASMSPMARSFWGENRRVSSARTKAALGIAWLYPSYREGLRAILAEEAGEHDL